MKKIICVSLITIFSASIFAVPKNIVTEKVLKIFHTAFPEVKQPSWIDYESYYEVYFVTSPTSSCRIDYSPEGAVLRTTRYYGAEDLSPIIRAKVNENYPGRKIFGITEVSNSENFTYHIVLEDAKYWYNIASDITGNTNLESKLLKAK